jgi:hypothetical protein
VIALSSDPKVTAFMRLAGLGDWICGVDDAAAVERKLAIIEDQPPTRAFVDEAIRANQRVAEQVLEIIR